MTDEKNEPTEAEVHDMSEHRDPLDNLRALLGGVQSMFGTDAPQIEPNAEQRQGAIAMRQMYLSYIEVGFTSQEALKLVITMLGNAMGGNA